MKVIDMHCDTIAKLYLENPSSGNYTLRSNPFHIDLQKMRQGDYLLQNFALFVDQHQTENAMEEALDMTDLYYTELEKNQDLILPVFTYEDILENQKNGKMSAMLTLEEGSITGGRLSHLRNFYRLGVRMIALTWNYENEIGYPNMIFDESGLPQFSQRNAKGLTAYGIDMIQEMEKLGIIIDVSHLSDGGFWDVLKYTTKPFAASHSNAASQCNICRNLTDDMIRALAERGGVMGLNFCADFLRTPKYPGSNAHAPGTRQISFLSDMVRHVRHITNIGGIEVCALGGDMDGISSDPEFANASGIGQLADALLAEGFSHGDIEKIFYKNVLRLYRDIL